MATTESVKSQLMALVSAAKQVTGIESNSLTTQVNALLSGYSEGTLTTITLLAANWIAVDNEDDDKMYSQQVTISGATANSRINLYPSATQLSQLEDDAAMLVVENDSGVTTVYSFNGKPSVDMEIQASCMEVTVL